MPSSAADVDLSVLLDRLEDAFHGHVIASGAWRVTASR
jgi:hypothetical protein